MFCIYGNLYVDYNFNKNKHGYHINEIYHFNVFIFL
jgi:hypothetical protein